MIALTFRHIRTLQQENKELRAALEEHQNALELIMSKYRQHVTRCESSSIRVSDVIGEQHPCYKRCCLHVIRHESTRSFKFTCCNCTAINLNPPLQAGQCSSSRFHEHKPAENPGCPIKHLIANQNLVSFLSQALAERTEKVCEMAAVMKVSIESKVVNLGLMLSTSSSFI